LTPLVHAAGRATDPEAHRLVIEQAEIWWADLEQPVGSGPGFRRPVLVVQCNALNRSRIGTGDRVRKIPRRRLELILSGIDAVLGR